MIDKHVQFFKALSDATRQEILNMLRDHEMNVSEICKALESMSQPTISHHLQILKNCELVDTRKEGKLIYYFLNQTCINETCQAFFGKFKMKIEYYE